MTPAITIMMPVHNAAETLEQTLDTIAEQTFSDYELLVVDDHSSDRSLEIISSRRKNDPRIRLVTNSGKGLAPALNEGLKHAAAPLIARMDGDDLMHPQRLEKQFNYLQQHPDIVALGSRAELFPQEEVTEGFREYMRRQNELLTPEQINYDIYVEAPFVHPSVTFRTDIIRQIGGYRDGMFPEDYDLWLRLYRAGHRMAKLPETLLHWREHPQRFTRTNPRAAREAFDKLRAHYLAQDPGFLQHKNNFAIWGAGRITRRRTEHLLSQGFSPQAWIDIDPRKIGNRLKGVHVHAPEWLVETKPFVLVYVANHGAQELIAAQLTAMGYRKGDDFLLIG